MGEQHAPGGLPDGHRHGVAVTIAVEADETARRVVSDDERQAVKRLRADRCRRISIDQLDACIAEIAEIDRFVILHEWTPRTATPTPERRGALG